MRLGFVVFCSLGFGLSLSACSESKRDFGTPQRLGGSTGEGSESNPASAPSSESRGVSSDSPVSAAETTEPPTSDSSTEDPNGDSGSSTSSPEVAASIGTESSAPASSAPTSSAPASSAPASSEPNTSTNPPQETNVRGHVIDFWGNPIANLEVEIDGKYATTDAAGGFVIDDVAPTYDVSFVVELSNPHTFYGWRYEHLSRRDPTLQVYVGLLQRQSTVLATPDVELESDDVVRLGMGSENGSWSTEISGSTYTTPTWRGPTQTLANLHALWVRNDPSTELPTGYLGYFSQAFALSDAESSNITLALNSDTRMDSDNIGGSVASPSNESRSNDVFLQFQDGTSLQVVRDYYPDPATFLYLVPSLPKASVIVSASEGNTGYAYAMSHRRDIGPGTMDAALTIPSPPKLSRPLAGDTVAADTEFSWSLSDSTNKVVVIHVEDSDYMQGLYIVTDRPTTYIPSFRSFGLRKGGNHYWEVETHMECATTDECAEAEGFLDPLVSAEYGIAKWSRDGSYAASGRRGFVTAP